jgi:hypothetical protein
MAGFKGLNFCAYLKRTLVSCFRHDISTENGVNDENQPYRVAADSPSFVLEQ